ncbi:unnamed protein product [Ceratitis capitata]|uniref:(Mediterranean fruit fly) hypothetical protein n=1 Tax=Ceratitis capitata TaxID=7213 RepID=A0A811V6E0_CERCA|nr:unnamed protein product [Ceratitis capitata]
MDIKLSRVAFICLAWATAVLDISNALTSNLFLRTVAKRQNNVCLNHTAGEFDRNPDDCRSFYLCLENGQAVLAPCPPTMLFNPVSKLCDTADNVNCEASTTGVANVSNNNNNNNHNGNNDNNNNNNSYNNGNSVGNALLNVSQYCASQPTEQNRIIFVGSSINCQQYFMCYYGQAVLQECSANLHWNANIAKCDLPEKAGCQLENGDTSASSSETINGNGNSGNGVGTSEIGSQSGGQSSTDELINCPIYGQHVFPHMSRCEYFIYCIKGHAILQQCPFYYNFDIVSKSCKWRRSAICVRDLNINFQKLIAK